MKKSVNGYKKGIFTPFPDIGRKKGEAGLGLQIARRIVSQHGGRIDIQTEPGHGTILGITLPALHTDHNQPEDRPPSCGPQPKRESRQKVTRANRKKTQP